MFVKGSSGLFFGARGWLLKEILLISRHLTVKIPKKP
jgi:hypothetical protein